MNRCARCSGELPALAVFCPHCSQPHEPDFDRLIGQTLDGRYRIYRRLGSGGLSTVFVATDLRSDCVVAIKVSDPSQLVRREQSYAIDEARQYWAEMLDRMQREAETLAEIDHPNIVRVHAAGSIHVDQRVDQREDLRYVAMEFLRGRTLREELDERGPMEAREAASIAVDIASALGEVHARGIIHRDINPRNIFLLDQQPSAIKLIDFGIARFPQPAGAPPFTRHAALGGTVSYASPEQCQSRPLDHRSDIYSLGVSLYEMLTGRRPFEGRTPTEIALKQIQAEPVPPRQLNAAIPASLEQTILRAMAKHPEERQQTTSELAEELRARSNQIVIPLNSVESETEIEPQAKPARRRRALAAAAALLLTLAAAGWLFGRQFTASIDRATASSDLVSALPSPSNQNSDADAMEEPGAWRSAGSRPPSNPMPRAVSTPQPQTSQTPPPTPTTDRAAQPRNSAPAAPINLPQSPPPSRPARQTESQPGIAQAPRPIEEPPQPPANTNPTANQTIDRPIDRESEPAPNHTRAESRPRRAQQPADDEEEEEEDERIGPKLIQWSGRVNGEREITIEMPGVPGTIEIPRAYRGRVGVIDPPNSDNRWRCAVLRVFGRGNVSFILRWWPRALRPERFSSMR
jgi:serine/threonine-protein kinase